MQNIGSGNRGLSSGSVVNSTMTASGIIATNNSGAWTCALYCAMLVGVLVPGVGRVGREADVCQVTCKDLRWVSAARLDGGGYFQTISAEGDGAVLGCSMHAADIVATNNRAGTWSWSVELHGRRGAHPTPNIQSYTLLKPP